LNIFDIIIFVVVFIGFVLGYKDGLVRKLIGLIGIALAIYLAIKFAFTLGEIIESITGIEIYLSEIIAGILIFLVVIFIFSVLKRYIHPFDKVNNFINQFIGGFVGSVQLLFFLSGLFIILNVFNTPAKESKENSWFYYKVYNIIPLTIDFLSRYQAKPKEIIKEYIRDKDTLK
jgi:membrane protein required for colicin V production